MPVTAVEPSYALVHLFIGYAECALNRFDRAIEAFSTALKLSSGDTPNVTALSHLGYAYGLAGETERAQQILRQLDLIAGKRYIPPQARVFPHLGMGNMEAALAGIEAMVHERSDYVIYLKQHVAFDVVRSEPRFIAALQKVYGPLARQAAK